jgi:cytochrome c oxidase subunit 3
VTAFDDAAQQAHAAKLGMWVFLASELLLFAGLFALWGSYRAEGVEAFHAGARRTDLALGTANTVVLLVSSFLVAGAVHARRDGRARGAAVRFGGAVLLGAVFLGLKGVEWSAHAREGLVPGVGIFWTLYYMATGLHALHVIAGMGVVGTAGALCLREEPPAPHVVENCGNYWHLVDAIWLFLWPMFYLMRGGG